MGLGSQGMDAFHPTLWQAERLPYKSPLVLTPPASKTHPRSGYLLTADEGSAVFGIESLPPSSHPAYPLSKPADHGRWLKNLLVFCHLAFYICYMAVTKTTRRTADRDFSLVFWTPETPEAELRTAFRNKWDWVVSSHTSTAARYATIVSNLLRTYSAPETATLDYVRSALVHGFHKDAFLRLKSVLDITSDELCEVIRVPSRTVARRELFKPDESERILRVASAFQRAIEVLGSLDKARDWFSGPKRALGDKTPLEFCDTELGAEEVCNLLGRIEHGVFT